MTLLFMDGFDHYDSAHLSCKWPDVGGGMTGASGGVGSAVSRHGGQALFMANTSASSNRYVSRSFTPGASWVIGFAFRTAAFPTTPQRILTLLDAGSAQAEVRLANDGTLSVRRNGTLLTAGTSVVAIAVNAWHYLEFKVTIADSIGAGSCKVRLNGVDIITVATGQDTKNTALAQANAVMLGADGGTGANVTWYYDDVYVCDQSGSLNNDFLGDVRVEAIYPTGAGNSTDFTPSAGSNWQCVDEAPPTDDTDYVQANGVGLKDTYAFGNLSATPTAIKGIQTCLLARKTDSGARGIAPVTRSGGADYAGATVSLADSYAYALAVRETDPATAAAWTQSGVDAAQFGVSIVS